MGLIAKRTPTRIDAFSLTPALSRWEREPVRPLLDNPNDPLSPCAANNSPSPSGRGPG